MPQHARVTLKLLILDVDGVLTSGELPYTRDGCEIKPFHVQDGSAIRHWSRFGGKTAIISGRVAGAVDVRARELEIGFVRQAVTNKEAAYQEACQWAGVQDAEVCAVGDDVQDLPILRRCGFPIAVANALPRVKRAARFITRRPGGSGAVAEVIERLLRHNGDWSTVLSEAMEGPAGLPGAKAMS